MAGLDRQSILCMYVTLFGTLKYLCKSKGDDDDGGDAMVCICR